MSSCFGQAQLSRQWAAYGGPISKCLASAIRDQGALADHTAGYDKLPVTVQKDPEDHL